jgi:RNA polymerase sigma factor (sigma-70 family)
VSTVVHVVDDDASFRVAISRLLRSAGYEVALHDSAQQLLDRLPGPDTPCCILLDVRIPGLSGPALQNRLTELGHRLPIVFLTGYGDIPTSVQTIKAGAEDFLTKPVPKDTLIAAIERATAHHRQNRAQLERLDALRALVATLTPREREVFELVVGGKMNKQIAHELGATERTIKAHRQKVMAKIQVQSLAELVSIAERLGILSASEAATRTASGTKA